MNGFIRIYLRVTLGASRLQEILADRFAAVAFGARHLIEGLKDITRLSLRFHKVIEKEVDSFANDATSLRRIYETPYGLHPDHLREITESFEEIVNAPTSPYSSHPSIGDRIELLEKIKSDSAIDDDPHPAIDLIDDADALISEMAAMMEENVKRNMAARK